MIADPLVERVVGKIAEAIHPTKIILFGSRATGKARPDSDLDLLIVYSGDKSKREVKLDIQRLFPSRNFWIGTWILGFPSSMPFHPPWPPAGRYWSISMPRTPPL